MISISVRINQKDLEFNFYFHRKCSELDEKNGGSISFGENSFTTKQCTGYVPHKPSWYDVEHVGKMLDYDPNISDTNNKIARSTYQVHG